ncbi:MAG: hypothetical protein ACLFWD_13710 [Anaerolineales bacterium]
MPRFLIEVPHDNTKNACMQAVKIFHQTGSHFMTNADWGCADNEHKAWFVVELDSKEQALSILPSNFRPKAKVIELRKLSPEVFDEAVDLHSG